MTLEEIKDKVARNHYGVDFSMLTDQLKVSIFNIIATEFALSECKDLTNRIKALI